MPIDVSVCCFRKSEVLELKNFFLKFHSSFILYFDTHKAGYFEKLTISNTLYNLVTLLPLGLT